MNLRLNVLRFENEDVIATSIMEVKGTLEGCYYFTGLQEIFLQGKKCYDGATVVNSTGFMPNSINTALRNVYGESATVEYNIWYAMYRDGKESYLYKHDDTALTGHTHTVSD